MPSHRMGARKIAQDGRAEDGAVQNAADGAVGALPHLFEVIFAHALHVGGDGRALDGNAQPLGRLGGIDGHLIVRLVAVRKAEVVVLRFEVDIGGEQDVLDLLPEDARHFVAVHLDERRFHLDLCHKVAPF